ncbi:baculoviral IAP repeat-containing protein 2-like [Ornithodoros turicata]|uniref:baculoviral IAP repeat-containing protein 2-like n=1 Tax=Ornithodoros turicata TaxID=34597 RepID=UPI003139F494
MTMEHHVAPDDSTSEERSSQNTTSIIPYSRPHSPDYAVISERIRSFNTYPENAGGNRENMARAGFFYTGRDDIVTCFHCGYEQCHWDGDDAPAVEHARWNPDCVFVRILLGDEHVRSIKQMHQALISQRLAEERRTGDAVAETRTLELMSLYASSNPVLSEAVSRDMVELAIRHRINTARNIDVKNEDDLINALADVTRLPKTTGGREMSGYDDCATCFQCGRPRAWRGDEDDACADHTKFSPCRCYVQRMLDDGAATNVRQMQILSTLQREVVESTLVDDSTQNVLRHLMSTPAIQRLVQRGFDIVIIKVAILRRLNSTGLIDVLDEEDVRRALADVVPLSSNVGITRGFKPKQEGVTKCVLCLRGDRNVVFLPCSHLLTCENCAFMSRCCPVCYSRVISRSIVYF